MAHKPLVSTSHPFRDAAQADAGRRRFVRQLGIAAAALGTLPLAACGGGDDDAPAVQFAHGIASGDPLADRVMLWTRVTPPAGHTSDIPVEWELATDSNFTSITAQGKTTALASKDFTVKVDATGLKAATAYYYRFRAYAAHTATGRTRTLPTGSVAQVKLAVFSCANYPAGYFNVYADAARRNDLDATVHLGDYVYEYARGGYASANAGALGRLSQPAHEILSLADYRQRHAQYKTDSDLQALHAAAPMIAVWDDHEITNDTWSNGAENHQSATEGSFSARKAAAMQAYHEWMPTRNAQPELIYRSFAFGNLVALHMLDTRVVARDEQLDYGQFFTATGFDAVAFTAAVGSTSRQLLGTTQTQWLQQQMATSSATWQVLGQQVLMGRMNIPAPILMETLQPGAGVTVSQYAALVGRAQTAPASLTPAEQAILAQPSIPYNLDAWDGYPLQREAILQSVRPLGKRLVTLSGDSHNAWFATLTTLAGQTVGHEFAGTSVSSPGFEALGLGSLGPALDGSAATAQLGAAAIGAGLGLVDDLAYADTRQRGYLQFTVTADAVKGEYVFVSTVKSSTYSANVGKTISVSAAGAVSYA